MTGSPQAIIRSRRLVRKLLSRRQTRSGRHASRMRSCERFSIRVRHSYAGCTYVKQSRPGDGVPDGIQPDIDEESRKNYSRQYQNAPDHLDAAKTGTPFDRTLRHHARRAVYRGSRTAAVRRRNRGHPFLDGRPNAVYIPHDRRGNKSGNLRVSPLDTELQALLSRWIRIRPDAGQPWLVLSERGNQLGHQGLNELWKTYFHPEYSETEKYAR